MARATVTTADRGTATMAAMPPLIMAGTPQRTATLPHITAAMDTALFAPHTDTTALGTIAGIVTVGDSQVAIPACVVRIVPGFVGFVDPLGVGSAIHLELSGVCAN
jgi:hypothetical protein